MQPDLVTPGDVVEPVEKVCVLGVRAVGARLHRALTYQLGLHEPPVLEPHVPELPTELVGRLARLIRRVDPRPRRQHLRE